jgi:hypothetical protein
MARGREQEQVGEHDPFSTRCCLLRRRRARPLSLACPPRPGGARRSRRRRRNSRAPLTAACYFARDSSAAPMGLLAAAWPSLLSPLPLLRSACEVIVGTQQVVGPSQPGGGPPSRQIRRRQGRRHFSIAVGVTRCGQKNCIRLL